MRRFILPALLATSALPVHAQERSLWELLHPDRIAAQVLRSGILALRSQMDITYSNLSISLRDGVLAADDITLALYDNITGGDVCEIRMAGLELLTGDPFVLDTITLSLAARSLDVGASCLPPDARPMLAMLGQTSLTLPELTIDLTYDMPSAAAQMSISATLDGVASVLAQADMAYVTIWAGDGSDGEPSGDLRAASVTLEDLGGWAIATAFLPPPLANPESAGAAASQMLGQMFEGMASEPVLPKGTKAFVVEAARGWADFVADPGRLVLETGFDPTSPVFVDAETFEDGPFAAIDLLQPVLSRVPAAERNALPAALLAQAIDSPEELDADQRREVGLALLTGVRAPRAVARGIQLLDGLVEAGDGEVAIAIARALAPVEPEAAYTAALMAGASGTPGSRSLLDQIEADVPFETRLRLQTEAGNILDDANLMIPTRGLAALAEAHLSGIGASRSLSRALLLGTLAAARGHKGAARLVERLGRMIPNDGRDAWAGVSNDVSEAALRAWIAEVR